MCSRIKGSTDQIDIDELNIPTLRELQRFFKGTLAAQKGKQCKADVATAQSEDDFDDILAEFRATDPILPTPTTNAATNATFGNLSATSSSSSVTTTEEINVPVQTRRCMQRQRHRPIVAMGTAESPSV
jgi:hypothetical protein